MEKVNLLNLTGILKLKDDLEMDYIIHSKEKDVNLTSELNKLTGKQIHIKIIDTKTDIIYFNYKGLLTKRKIVTDDFRVGNENLSDVLWELTEVEIRFVLDIIETEDEVKEGAAK